MGTLNYIDIQTPEAVWIEILQRNPIDKDKSTIFLEPFSGEDSLYSLIECEKEWCEITKGRDIFNYDFVSVSILINHTVIWSNLIYLIYFSY